MAEAVDEADAGDTVDVATLVADVVAEAVGQVATRVVVVVITRRELAAKDIPVTMVAAAPELVCFDARVTMQRDDLSYQQRSITFKLCAPGSAVEK
jgi:hypothetical protein